LKEVGNKKGKQFCSMVVEKRLLKAHEKYGNTKKPKIDSRITFGMTTVDAKE